MGFPFPHRSAPTQFMEGVVVDPKMMGDLVDHGDQHLVAEFVEVFTVLAESDAVQGDSIGECERLVVVSIGEWYALIQPVELLLGMVVLDDNDDVVEEISKLVWQKVERFANQLLERRLIDHVHFWPPYRRSLFSSHTPTQGGRSYVAMRSTNPLAASSTTSLAADVLARTSAPSSVAM